MRFCLVFLLMGCLAACRKNNSDRTPSEYRVVTAIHHLNGETDTTRYSYNGRNVDIRQVYSRNPSEVYLSRYVLEGNGYRLTSFTGATQTQSGWFRIGANGYIDSSRTIRQNATINNTLLYTYDSEGKEVRNQADWGTYKNDYRKFYSNGNYSYWLNDYTNAGNPSLNQRDSIAFEFYTDKPQKIFYKGHLPEMYGKPLQNLVKSRSYYNMSRSSELYQRWEYNYLTDAQGYVTREVWLIYSYPGSVLQRSDTTYYSYGAK
ncbi:hypothetical protein JMG10_07470 [Nostoc ellipsosporum NOK]|nr:hypothetical protein [Nostoc ellipsosporum NOK]